MRLCPIASGSSGNCILVWTDTTKILVDVGISKKRIEEGLGYAGVAGADIDAILITHEHADHIQGLGVFTRKYPTPVYATSRTIQAILGCTSLGKLDVSSYNSIRPDEGFMIGDIEVVPMKTSHDAADSVAYRFFNNDKKVAIATDLGCYNDYIVDSLQGLNAILIEANHDIRMLEMGPYPYPLKRRILSDVGHLSNEMAGRLLCDILHDDLSDIILGHLSKENNYPELAYETVRMEIEMGDNPYHPEDFKMCVAKRDVPTGVIEI